MRALNLQKGSSSLAMKNAVVILMATSLWSLSCKSFVLFVKLWTRALSQTGCCYDSSALWARRWPLLSLWMHMVSFLSDLHPIMNCIFPASVRTWQQILQNTASSPLRMVRQGNSSSISTLFSVSVRLKLALIISSPVPPFCCYGQQWMPFVSKPLAC